jgi:hypothetical protein
VGELKNLYIVCFVKKLPFSLINQPSHSKQHGLCFICWAPVHLTLCCFCEHIHTHTKQFRLEVHLINYTSITSMVCTFQAWPYIFSHVNWMSLRAFPRRIQGPGHTACMRPLTFHTNEKQRKSVGTTCKFVVHCCILKIEYVSLKDKKR